MGVLVGIDIGTHRSKAVACAPDGRVLARAAVPHGVSTPAAGHVEHDADATWWADLVALTRRLAPGIRRAGGADAIAVTTCGPCLVPVDAAGRPLRPAILYGVDSRAAPQIAALEARHGRAAIERRSWSALTSQSVGPKIAWIAEHEPDVHARTAAYHTATSYLVLRLTGVAAIDHHQGSYFAPFIDARRRAWDLRFADGLDLAGRLPPLRWPDEIAGGLTAAAARETGLAAGTPVLVGSSDGLAEAMAAGAAEPGVIAATYGTTATLTAFHALTGRARGLWRTEGTGPDRTMVAGGMAASGAVNAWFLRELARELPQDDPEAIAGALRTLGAEAAAVPPGARGLLMLPYLHGERTPIHDPAAAGVLAGLRAEHTRADVYRAVLESIAHGVRHLADTLGAAGVPLRVLRATGGMTADPAWLRIVTDITGLPHEILAEPDGAPYGIARLAGAAIGLDVSDAGGWLRVRDVLTPDLAVHAADATPYALYRRLHRDTRAVVHALGRARTEGPDA